MRPLPPGPAPSPPSPSDRVLAVRTDSVGDVLLCGPAVRALAAGGAEVTFLASPRGEPAARLLPGVSRTMTFDTPWIAADPPPADPVEVERLVGEIRALGVDRAVVFTSFHQSALPMALLLRLAGVPHVAAISDDYPGSLLDVRHRVPDDLHEVERALSLAATCGDRLVDDDDDRLRIRGVDRHRCGGSFVVVHPGASAPARTLAPEVFRDAVAELIDRGRQVVVTGGPGEERLAEAVRGDAPGATWMAGRLDLHGLARLVAAADALVVGNTGPAHVAAAVGTPVVSAYPPTVPWERWRPWRVPAVRLGDQEVPCAGCRARSCPQEVQHCFAGITAADVADAVDLLVGTAGP